MTASQKDDADHLAVYAENLLENAKSAVALSNTNREQWLESRAAAIRLLMRARIAIKEAQTQIK